MPNRYVLLRNEKTSSVFGTAGDPLLGTHALTVTLAHDNMGDTKLTKTVTVFRNSRKRAVSQSGLTHSKLTLREKRTCATEMKFKVRAELSRQTTNTSRPHPEIKVIQGND